MIWIDIGNTTTIAHETGYICYKTAIPFEKGDIIISFNPDSSLYNEELFHKGVADWCRWEFSPWYYHYENGNLKFITRGVGEEHYVYLRSEP